MGKQRLTVNVTIPNAASESGEVNVGQHRIVGIQMPAAWTAAGLFLKALVRSSGVPPTHVFSTVQDNAGADLVLAAGPVADDYIALPDTVPLRGLGRIKVGSGTGALPVAQGAERILTLILVED